MTASRLFRSVLPLATAGVLACNGSATPTPAEEPDPPEYLGMYVVTDYFDDFPCTLGEPASTPADWEGTHALVESSTFFGQTTIDVYPCTGPTEDTCDTAFSEFFLLAGSNDAASGEVESWSESGGECSFFFSNDVLTWDGTTIEITSTSTQNADSVSGNDLDECEVALEQYSGDLDCFAAERLVLDPI
jgi:hypothetical protein